MSVTPTSFSALKRSRGTAEHLVAAIQQSSQAKREDDRFWELSVDKAGNGHAIIRFLPAPPQDGEDGLPWVRTFSHAFRGPGGWLIDLCSTTVDQKCPICEANSLLWNSGIEANKAIARDRKRKLSYTVNILVVSDPAKPENEGKVKLFRFGKKIWDKVFEKMHPDPAFGEQPMNPFDLWEGANFKLRARKVADYRNYDSSEFQAPSAVSADEAKLEEIWKQEHSLAEIIAAKNFKTHEQTKSRLAKVLGSAPLAASAAQTEGQPYSDPDAGIVVQSKPATGPVVAASTDPEEDADLKFFEGLAADGE
jgi:hypothetical protein